MGFLLDFFSLFFRRPQPRPPAVWNGPVARFRAAACLDALAWLDTARASEVLGYGSHSGFDCIHYGTGRRQSALEALEDHPVAAWIFCFDRDGHVRQAALRRLSTPAITTGRFVAVAVRLNDWVPNVRQEAVEAFRRIWPITSPEVIAEAAPYLLQQRYLWRRWGDEALCIDEALGSPAATEVIVAKLLRSNVGGLGILLRQALRYEALDPSLVRLATEARRPDVRATALKTILTGKATWHVGYGRVWIDKSMTKERRVARTESRTVAITEPPGLLQAGLEDRSALVRKTAADVAVDRMHDLPDAAGIAARLAGDTSPAVRLRGDYMIRHLATSAV